MLSSRLTLAVLVAAIASANMSLRAANPFSGLNDLTVSVSTPVVETDIELTDFNAPIVEVATVVQPEAAVKTASLFSRFGTSITRGAKLAGNALVTGAKATGNAAANLYGKVAPFVAQKATSAYALAQANPKTTAAIAGTVAASGVTYLAYRYVKNAPVRSAARTQALMQKDALAVKELNNALQLVAQGKVEFNSAFLKAAKQLGLSQAEALDILNSVAKPTQPKAFCATKAEALLAEKAALKNCTILNIALANAVNDQLNTKKRNAYLTCATKAGLNLTRAIEILENTIAKLVTSNSSALENAFVNHVNDNKNEAKFNLVVKYATLAELSDNQREDMYLAAIRQAENAKADYKKMSIFAKVKNFFSRSK